MTTEKITVVGVDGPNSNGWYEAELEDGRKVSTKDEEVAKEAFQSRGSEVDAIISSSTKGKFTNVYLNQINGVGNARPPRKTVSATPSSPARSGGRTPAENDRIARQWALGRSVELLVGSGAEFAFPLDDATKKQLTDTADFLLNSTK